MEDDIYDVKITDTAWEQAIECARFLANVSVDAANRFVDAFVESTDSLTRMPERCPWLEHDAMPFQKYRKILFGKYYIALFRIHGSAVYVTAVIDCRRDCDWLL
jgi:plasmid stabilization system protein ParE